MPVLFLVFVRLQGSVYRRQYFANTYYPVPRIIFVFAGGEGKTPDVRSARGSELVTLVFRVLYECSSRFSVHYHVPGTYFSIYQLLLAALVPYCVRKSGFDFV